MHVQAHTQCTHSDTHMCVCVCVCVCSHEFVVCVHMSLFLTVSVLCLVTLWDYQAIYSTLENWHIKEYIISLFPPCPAVHGCLAPAWCRLQWCQPLASGSSQCVLLWSSCMMDKLRSTNCRLHFHSNRPAEERRAFRHKQKQTFYSAGVQWRLTGIAFTVE